MIYLSDSIRPMRHICTLNMPQWQKYAAPVDLLVEAKICLNHHFCRVGIFARWHTLCSAHSYHPCRQNFATIKCVGGKIWGHWQIRLYSVFANFCSSAVLWNLCTQRGTILQQYTWTLLTPEETAGADRAQRYGRRWRGCWEIDRWNIKKTGKLQFFKFQTVVYLNR